MDEILKKPKKIYHFVSDWMRNHKAHSRKEDEKFQKYRENGYFCWAKDKKKDIFPWNMHF